MIESIRQTIKDYVRMVRIISIILLAVGLVSATPWKSSTTSPNISTAQNTLSTRTNTGSSEPCAIVSRSLASQASRTLSDEDKYSVDPEDAHACLMSVPVDQEGGIAQLDGLRELLEFQSSLGYLKEPPPGYIYDGVDLIAGIQKLSKALSLGQYDKEYDFQNAVYRLFVSAHDGHLSYTADIRNIFTFCRSFGLVSLSLDGKILPQVYAYDDFQAILNTDNDDISDYTPSPITLIEGQPVDTYLGEQASRYGSSQDPDASYNRFFVNAPPLAEKAGYNFPIFDNKSTTFGFANGTNLTTIHRAAVSKDTDFNGRFDDPDRRPGLSRGPIIDIFQENEDLAVLRVGSFGPGEHLGSADASQFVRDFEKVARNFTATAKSAGKSNLIIDLRGNSGGMIILVYALFNVLCPSLTPYDGFNLRAFPLANHIGQSISGSVESRRANWQSAFNYKHHLNTSLEQFMSWEEFYGPYESHNDSFMSLARENLNETFGAEELSSRVYYSSNDSSTSPEYAQEDIILLLDGQCASACSVFVEAMKTEAGVRQIAIGGRAQYGPMQGVGGVKGSEVLRFPQLVEFVEKAKDWSWTDTYWNTNEAPNLENMSRAIARGQGPDTVNFKNTIRRGDDSTTPLQFVYEAADCRIFYTPDMYAHANNIYAAVYDAIWGDGECVSGSTGHLSSSSLTGSDALVPPPPGARPASV
ncbi:hypothetical protein BDV97DRAFT_368313 [Delphinella strobiligena]|nr:hypothetical protein BDV97DRAFT_368313 [Delphinella strobiligena]